MRKIYCFFILVILIVSNSSAQYHCIDCSDDSLLTIWKKVITPPDSLYAYVVSIDNGDYGGSIYNYPDKEIQQINKLLYLNKKLKLINDSGYIFLRDGLILWNDKKSMEAIEKFKQSVSQFDKNKKILGDLSVLNKLRSYFSNAGLSEERLKYFQMKLNQYLQNGPKENTAVCYHSLGGYFLNHRNDYNLAINNYLKASEIFKSYSQSGYANEITITGLAYFMWGNNERARYYLELAKPLIEKSERWNLKIISNNLLAQIDEASGDYEGAINKLNESLAVADTIGVKAFLAITLALKGNLLLDLNKLDEAYLMIVKSIAIKDSFSIKPNSAEGFFEGEYFLYKYYVILKDHKKAEEFLLRALNQADANNSNLLIQKYRKELIAFYNKANQFQKAALVSSQFIYLQDSLRISQNKYNIASYETEKIEREKEIEAANFNNEKRIQATEISRQKIIRNSFIFGFAIVLLFALIFFSQRNKIRSGKKRSDDLLLNILPTEVAEELKSKGSADAKQFESVTVMFTDFKNFTKISELLSPTELVNEIHTCFKAFDEIISKHNIEKIKTIGDSYMCAGGLPVANKTNAIDVLSAAMEIQNFMQQHSENRKSEGKEIFEIRIGIHTGPVVAGIVGVKKFAYDIWGDTVNIASRMESSGEAGKVNISGSTYELVKEKFKCIHRGKIQAKNKGEIDMYFVETEIKF